MAHWIMSHGALPVLVPTDAGYFRPENLIEDIDGFLLQGGSDVSPRSYGEEPLRPEWQGDAIRDAYESELLKACMRADVPVLGVCRGAQLINVALGGTLYQDIQEQQPASLVHRDWQVYDELEHEVEILAGSRLSEIYGAGPGRINSIHHQAIKDLAPDLEVEARSLPDGMVEAIRYRSPYAAGKEGPYVFAVQWHPEFQPARDPTRLPREPIFEDFLTAIRRRTQRA